VPESILVMLATTLVGWGTFTWKRAEEALVVAQRAVVSTDRLEVKLAEKYVTKEDFRSSINAVMQEFTRTREDIKDGFTQIRGEYRESYDQLGESLNRLEDKVVYHVDIQAKETSDLRKKLEQKGQN